MKQLAIFFTLCILSLPSAYAGKKADKSERKPASDGYFCGLILVMEIEKGKIFSRMVDWNSNKKITFLTKANGTTSNNLLIQSLQRSLGSRGDVYFCVKANTIQQEGDSIYSLDEDASYYMGPHSSIR